jgi:hypothetical protein
MLLKPLRVSLAVAPPALQRLPEAQRCNLLVAGHTRVVRERREVEAAVAEGHVVAEAKCDE